MEDVDAVDAHLDLAFVRFEDDLREVVAGPVAVGRVRDAVDDLVVLVHLQHPVGETLSTVNGPATRTLFLCSYGLSYRYSKSALRAMESSIASCRAIRASQKAV